MLNDITIVRCEVMSHLVRLRGKDTVQTAHCAVCILSQRNIVDIRRQILLIVVDKSNSKKGKSYRTSFCQADWRSSTLSSAGRESSQVMITDSQDQRPLRLRLQELEEGVCHHGEAEQPQHSLLARGRLCRLLLLMSSSTSSLGGNLGDSFGSKRIQRLELHEEISRCLFNCDHHFFDDDGNGEMSMNMIVTTKEVFQLKKYVQKRKNNVCSGLLFNEE